MYSLNDSAKSSQEETKRLNPFKDKDLMWKTQSRMDTQASK